MSAWMSPADMCLLVALERKSSISLMGGYAARLKCRGVSQEHRLVRISQSQVNKLWDAGACRGPDGLPLTGPDGVIMCAFNPKMVAWSVLYRDKNRFEFNPEPGEHLNPEHLLDHFIGNLKTVNTPSGASSSSSSASSSASHASPKPVTEQPSEPQSNQSSSASSKGKSQNQSAKTP